jgi:hypothetical protein
MSVVTAQGITTEAIEKISNANNVLIAFDESPGYAHVNKFGENADIDTATTPEDIWEQGGVYTYSTTNDIDTISSSNTADKQSIQIEGLDLSYNIVTQTTTLNGQAKVTLATPLLRVYRMINKGAADMQGVVYCYVDTVISNGVPTDTTKIRAEINNGNNQTLMTHYTVPNGKKGVMTNFTATIGRAITTVAHMHLLVREQGGVFAVKDTFDLDSSAQSTYSRVFDPPLKIASKSDVKIQCVSTTTNNTVITAAYDMILKDIT